MTQRSQLLWRLETPAGLAAMFGAAFLLRILIAPHFGFYSDLHLFKIWTAQLADAGTHHFYIKGQYQDYPPGYLYVLWLTGKVSATPGYLLLKLPAIVADLALAWLAGTLAARLATPSLIEH
jgi:Gpi18-like mannosyltransferase